MKLGPYLKELGRTRKDIPSPLGRFFKSAFRKDKNGVAPEELWSLDVTLAEIIYVYIRAYRELEKFGVPWDIESIEEWNDILLQIENGFRRYLEEDLLIHPEHIEEFRNAMELLSIYFTALWD